MRRACHRAKFGGGVRCPDFSDTFLKGERRNFLCKLSTDILSDDLGKLIGELCRALREQDFQICIDEVQMDGRIAEVILTWEKFVLDEGE